MISKVLASGYNDSGQFPAAAIIPSFSKGLDRDTLRKRASIFDNEYDKFERKPKHTYIHLISVAAGEQYGPNSRADFYNGDSYRHDFLEPEDKKRTFIILDGGLNKYHDKTFMANGAPYTEHYSSVDGAKPQGYIVAAKMNPAMKRGELIIGVEDDKWADSIEQLAEGKPLKFSIGAAAKHDICSICGRVAHTEGEHCDHYKHERSKIGPEGHQVYVISDNCVFHDISRVKNPAEKIAFSIRKVAAADDLCLWRAPEIKPNVARQLLKTAYSQERFDTLAKLATIEKKIQATTLGKGLMELFRKRKSKKIRKCASDVAKELNSFIGYVGEHDRILKALKVNNKILNPAEFSEFLIPEDVRESTNLDIDKVLAMLPDLLEKILHSDDVDEFCNDRTYDFDNLSCTPMLISDANRCSIEPVEDVDNLIGDVLSGVSDLTPANKTVIISISQPENSPEEIVAKDYINYLLSSTKDFSPEKLTMTLLNNFV